MPAQTTVSTEPHSGAIENRVESANLVFAKYGDFIEKSIKTNLKDQSMADDIFQNFYIYLVRRPLPDNIQNPTGYLYRALRNDILDAGRKRQFYKKRLFTYAVREPRTEIKNHCTTMAKYEQAGRIFEQLEKILAPHEAEAVRQRYFHENSNEIAAKQMGVNKRTFSRYLCVAMRKLREGINVDND